jgi:chromosome segregation ATPase
MGYLVTHIAVCLVFAQLLGLLLGWLLWGYPARQRAKEVQALRGRIADLQLLTPRMVVPKAALAATAPVSYSLPPESPDKAPEKATTGQGATEEAAPELAEDLQVSESVLAEPSRRAFFEHEPESAGHSPEEATEFEDPANFIAPDLEAEVKEARLRHFEQQVRDLEGLKQRVPLLEAELSAAVAARREADRGAEQLRIELEGRLGNLLLQVRDFEAAALEWDQVRDEFERTLVARDKELATVKAHLRDLQNNQLPQKAEPAVSPGLSALEVADLRDRYQKVVQERDSIAAELEQWKRSQGSRYKDAERLAELEELLRMKDANLADQAARVESLLWRVAELEPFADAAPRLEEELRRQESEIAGHLAMHSESSDHIRTLLNRVAELESESAREAELETELKRKIGEYEGRLAQLYQSLETRELEIQGLAGKAQEIQQAQAEQAAEIKRLADANTDKDSRLKWMSLDYEAQSAEFQRVLEQKDWEIKSLAEARAEQAGYVAGLEARITALDEQARWVDDLEKLLTSKDAEFRRLSAAHADLRNEVQTWQNRALELEKALEQAQGDKTSELTSLNQRLAELEERLTSSQHALASQEQRHQAEVARLRMSLAQRVRRLRQSL